MGFKVILPFQKSVPGKHLFPAPSKVEDLANPEL